MTKRNSKIIVEIIIAFLLTFSSLALVFYYNSRAISYSEDLSAEEEFIIEEAELNYLYNIPSDSFRIERGRVKNNQTFSVILSGLGIIHEDINKVLGLASDFFDARKLRAGNNYTVFHDSDSIDNAAYFVYEKDPVEYVVFQFKDSLNVWAGQKDIDTIRQVYAGSISTSLWDAFTSGGANPMAAIELSEIYAWSLDFFGLQKGDSFKIIYDELFVDDMSCGIGTVYAAYFNHAGKDIIAIPFNQDDKVDFFDYEGNSMRKAFLKAPLRYRRISSRFSPSRLHPILRIRRPHYGVDYSAPVGTPVFTVGDGVVTKASYEGGSGYMVSIRHNSTYSTSYLHLRGFAPGIKAGAHVKQGDLIGYVGSTGLSTGPHLDFRFYKNGHPVDPLKIEAPPVEPIKEENREEFYLVREEVINMLESSEILIQNP